MSQHRSDAEIINKTRNTARFFVETRHVAWVLLIATCLWGVYGYWSMPQRKDPEVQVRTAVALTPWRGAIAEKIEQLVTKKIETQMAAKTARDALAKQLTPDQLADAQARSSSWRPKSMPQ